MGNGVGSAADVITWLGVGRGCGTCGVAGGPGSDGRPLTKLGELRGSGVCVAARAAAAARGGRGADAAGADGRGGRGASTTAGREACSAAALCARRSAFASRPPSEGRGGGTPTAAGFAGVAGCCGA